MVRRLVCGALLMAISASGGCIAVGASKEVRAEPRQQIAVIDNEIYIVDIHARKAWKVPVEGIDEPVDATPTMSGN